MVLLTRVDAGSQPLLRPSQRLKRSPGVAGGVLDVHITAAGGAGAPVSRRKDAHSSTSRS